MTLRKSYKRHSPPSNVDVRPLITKRLSMRERSIVYSSNRSNESIMVGG